MKRIVVSVLVLIVCATIASATLNVRLSDQGTNVYESGVLVESANLTIELWDNESGGTLVYNNTFTDAIVNGSWNVNIDANLEYGATYYKDYQINGVDLDFGADERLRFDSPLGDISNEDITATANIAPSKVNGTAATLTGNQSFDSGTLFIDATNDRVGVKTDAPAQQLHVLGNMTVDQGTLTVNHTNTRNNRPSIYIRNCEGSCGSTPGANTYGLWSSASSNSSEAKYGIRATAFGYDGDRYGVYVLANGIGSDTNYGLYAEAVNAATNWAGYFPFGDVYIGDMLGIGTDTPSSTLDVAGNVTLNDTLYVHDSGVVSVGADADWGFGDISVYDFGGGDGYAGVSLFSDWGYHSSVGFYESNGTQASSVLRGWLGYNPIFDSNFWDMEGTPLILIDVPSAGAVGINTNSPSSEAQVHIESGTDDNFGVLVDHNAVSGSEIGLHTDDGGYSSLVKNAYYDSGNWNLFDTGSGAFIMETAPSGQTVMKVAEADTNPASFTDAMTIKSDAVVRIDELFQLQPVSAPTIACGGATEGAIYYDSDIDELCFCDPTGWKQVDGGGGC